MDNNSVRAALVDAQSTPVRAALVDAPICPKEKKHHKNHSADK
jgi:hypothetical protein